MRIATIMIHLTLNSGHVRESPRSEVDDAVVATLTPFTAPGQRLLPIPGDYVVRTDQAEGGGLLATVFAPGARPCITVGVAANDSEADVVWPHLEQLYLRVTDLPGLRAADFEPPRRPVSTPWVVAVVIAAGPAEAYWMGDFERCLAWAYLESTGRAG